MTFLKNLKKIRPQNPEAIQENGQPNGRYFIAYR
jgi:hypothetical protein